MKILSIIKILFFLGLTKFCFVDAQSNLLFKTWTFKSIDKEDSRRYLYENAENLEGEHFGYTFFPNGKLIVKQSSSWCPVGETKIKFEVVEGKWEMINDSMISLKHHRYGNQIEDKRIISFVSKNELVLKFNRKYK
jgi:hypothetical protein